jgi:hypothetical protein
MLAQPAPAVAGGTQHDHLDGQEWETDLNRISHVGQVGIRPGDFFGGGLRPRLRIRMLDGREELFGRITSAVDSARSTN